MESKKREGSGSLTPLSEKNCQKGQDVGKYFPMQRPKIHRLLPLGQGTSTVPSVPTARKTTRRRFLKAGLGILPLLAWKVKGEEPPSALSSCLSSNQYSWTVYLARERKRFKLHPEETFRLIRQAGLDGLEPIAQSVDQIKKVGLILQRLGLKMPSIYMNSVLHEPRQADQSIQKILAIAQVAKSFGTKILVTNPSPIRWGSQEAKSDQQLVFQAKALNRLGKALKQLGILLAYHNHDIELRYAAREFHHMMVGTNPQWVSLCLDAHWIYRGAGDSQVALWDVVELYGDRIVEVHLRQSHNGTWSEVFTAKDDIDYERLFRRLREKGVRPLWVLEQAVESGTPHTLDSLTCFQKSTVEIRRLMTREGFHEKK